MINEDLLTKDEILSCMELGKALTSELDTNDLFRVILNKLEDLIPAYNWSLLLQNAKTEKLTFQLCVGIDSDSVKDITLAPGEGIAGHVAKTQESLIIEDVTKSDLFTNKIDKITGFETKAIICVPLIYGNQTVGVLEAINPGDCDERVAVLLKIIADYAAIAVENTRRFKKIQKLVNQDNLTSLYNTRYLYKSLAKLIERSQKDNKKVSLIFLDLDNFKQVVDNYGHLNGSKAIQEIAISIKKLVTRPEYGVCYAGDEFIVVLPDTDKEQALAKADIIMNSIKESTYLESEGGIKVSASFGVATFPEDASTHTELIGYADKAMFKIKNEGKNAVGGDV